MGVYFRTWVFVFVVLYGCVSSTAGAAAGKVWHYPDRETASKNKSKAAWRSAHPLAAWDLDGNVGPAWLRGNIFYPCQGERYVEYLKALPPVLLDASMLPNANETVMWFGHSFIGQIAMSVYAAAVANDAPVNVEDLCVIESADDDGCLVPKPGGATDWCCELRGKKNIKTKKGALAWEELVVGRKPKDVDGREKFEDGLLPLGSKNLRFHLSNGAVIYVIKNSAHFQDPASGGVANLKHFLKVGERADVTFDTVYYMEPHNSCFFEDANKKDHCYIDIEETARSGGNERLQVQSSDFLQAFLESSARQVLEIVPWSGGGMARHHVVNDLVFDTATYLKEHSHGTRSCSKTTGESHCTGKKIPHGHQCLPGLLTSLTQSVLAWSERLRWPGIRAQ